MTDPFELTAGAVVHFPEGIPGFETARRFVILRHDDYDPFLFLQDVDNSLLGLAVVPAQTVDPGYRIRISPRDRELLGFSEAPMVGSNVVCLLVVVLPGKGSGASCNLFAPVVINPATMRGKQVMQMGSDYPSLLPLAAE